MKRIFTLTILMTAFVMNVAAWEPVIKETHWFGMHEYYGAPIIGVTSTSMNSFIQNSGFSDIKTEKRTINNNEVTIDVLNGWTETASYFSGSGMGKIGTCSIYLNKWQGGVPSYTNPSVTDYWHSADDYCIGLEARKTDAVSFSQEFSLPAGDYTLKFDVQNVNSSTTSSTTTDYSDLFYVKVGNTEYRENYSNNQATWMTYNNGDWSTHTISFSTDGTNPVIISLGYGVKNGIEATNTPQLYVSHLQLDVVGNNSEGISRITWSDNYIESITVVRDWTGKTPPQQPKTSYYSWIDHNLRFSVGNTASWGLAKGDGDNHYDWNGLGLCNTSNDYDFFHIHNLKTGDKISIEYYIDKQNLPMWENQQGYNFVYDVDGLTGAGVLADCSKGTNIVSKQLYTVNADGIVRFNVGKKIIIRSVTIIHASANYKKATYRIDEVRDGQSIIGYKYTLTNSGVLEDHRGAVPYITMRFGAENDMTFVRDLGNGKYAASSIIDESDVFNPTTARFQNYYQDLSEEQAKDRLANKEWTIFSTDLDSNGKDIFSSILPEYGTYYYFFPEVNGKLSVRFYCEGVQEHMPFWFKSKDGVVVDLLKAGQDTDGSNYYEYNDIEVEKGAVYYLCANPTIIQHEHPIVRLISYSFIPTFRVDPLYKVVENGTESVTGAATIKGVTISEFTGTSAGYVFDNDAQITINGENAPMIKFLGNVKKDGTVIKLSQNGDDVKLDFTNIAYKSGDNINKGGAIVVNLDCPAGKATFVLTVAYNAAEARMDNGVRVRADKTNNPNLKKWDFFTNELEIGQYKNGSGTYPSSAWTNSSTLYKEVHKADGLTGDWLKTYVTLKENGTGEEPIFKSVYDMEGDNADMIHETAGLIFMTQSNLLGIYNENGTTSGSFNDRYIGLMGPKEMPLEHGDHEHHRALIIPRLKAGDRIAIKMGCYGNSDNDIATRTATLKITGGKDAVGTVINGDYIIGGSGSESGNFHTGATADLSKPYGEYHFIAEGGGLDGDGVTPLPKDFTLEVKEADLLKIYSIEIYRNADNGNEDILTENTINSNVSGHEILNVGSGSTTMNINLKYSGQAEGSADLTSSTAVSKYRTGSFMGTAPSFTNSSSTLAAGQFGLFRARLGVKTTNGAYVTDYADYDMAVGYLEKKTYPYTWDFTDLKKYAKAGGDLSTSTGDEILASGVDTNLSIWDNYGLNVKTTGATPETTFVPGGQLYAGDGMFAESRGIGIVPTSSSTTNVINLGTTDENGGLQINSADLTVPQVAAGDAIYVRAHKDDNDAAPSYKIGSGSSVAFTPKATTDESGDEIFAMQMADGASTADVALSFNGYTVKKIAVSNYAKTVNKYGWATESRDHVIDPELTSYMTGQNFKTFLVTGMDYETSKVTMTAIENTNLMPAASNNGDTEACIIHNEAGAPVDIVGGGFHLFVPDMHDKAESGSIKSEVNMSDGTIYLLRAQLTPTTEETLIPSTSDDGNYTNFAFTYNYYDLDKDYKITGSVKEGEQSFYRIAADGARSKGNQAYLPLETASLNGDVASGSRGISLLFDDKTDATTIDNMWIEAPKDNVYYNLSGQKLEGKPNRHGLYIVNGKKMYVK